MALTKRYIATSIVTALVLPAVVIYALYIRELTVVSYFICAIAVLLSELLAFWFRYRKSEVLLSLVVRSFLFSLSWISVFLWLPSLELAIVYALVTLPLFFLARILLSYGNETVIAAHTILTAAGLSVMPFALEQYLGFGNGILTLVIFAWEFLLSFFTFTLTPRSGKNRTFHALLIALLGTQVYVTLLFLPFRFTTLGLMLLLAYYWLWTVVYNYMAGVLSAKKVKFYSILVTLLLLATIFFTNWDPL